jgi:hypothetical protein
MRTNVLIAVLAVVLAGMLVAPAVGLGVGANDNTVAEQTDQTNQTENANENATAPGEQLSGVVGVQEAEFEGDIEQRTFGIQIAKANTSQAQADVVGQQLDTIEQRMTELEEKKADLDEEREAGNIPDGKYRAEVAKLATETQTTETLLNRSNETASQLPDDVLADRNVNVDSIRTLQDRAQNLTGQEVAEIARGIAGPNAGQTPAGEAPVDVPERPDAPGDAGPPDTPDDGDDSDDEETDGSDGETTTDGEDSAGGAGDGEDGSDY